MVIWRLIDEKPGHQNQSIGLCTALERITPLQCFDITVEGRWSHFVEWLLGRFTPGKELPSPDLIIGAGHATHFGLLAARRHRGGRSVVLMKPTLPVSWFDLCIAPEHDRVSGANVFTTQGVINAILPSQKERGEQLLILVGGISQHCQWDDDLIIEQILAISEASPQANIIVTDSRRTPVTFLEQLQNHQLNNLTITSWKQTPPDWVGQQLAESKVVWVTPDSVSMVYESITSGATVGLFDLASKGEGRVSDGIQMLLAKERITAFSRWRESGHMAEPKGTFCEADRCANWMLTEWQKSS